MHESLYKQIENEIRRKQKQLLETNDSAKKKELIKELKSLHSFIED